MSFHGPFDAQDEVMSEINMTPLVDVMLVLLVIFMLTVPVLTQAVRLELPKASTVAEQPEPDAVTVSVAADGSIFWNEAPVSRDEFRLRLQESAARSPQPMLRIRGDRKAEYDHIAQAMVLIQQAGISRIGFVTEAAGSQ